MRPRQEFVHAFRLFCMFMLILRILIGTYYRVHRAYPAQRAYRAQRTYRAQCAKRAYRIPDYALIPRVRMRSGRILVLLILTEMEEHKS